MPVAIPTLWLHRMRLVSSPIFRELLPKLPRHASDGQFVRSSASVVARIPSGSHLQMGPRAHLEMGATCLKRPEPVVARSIFQMVY